jgi:hypothetical protein
MSNNQTIRLTIDCYIKTLESREQADLYLPAYEYTPETSPERKRAKKGDDNGTF